MAKNDNLKDFLTDVANAIREKEGSSEPINPQDFSSRIQAIQTGGGGGDTPAGGSNIVYLNIETMVKTMESQLPMLLKMIVGGLACRLQYEDGTLSAILPSYNIGADYLNTIVAIAIVDNFLGWVEETNYINSSEMIESLKSQMGAYEITAEEFYKGVNHE